MSEDSMTFPQRMKWVVKELDNSYLIEFIKKCLISLIF